MDNLQALAEMLDRDRIRNAVVTLARGEDRRDADLVSSAFWPDATFDYGVFEGDFPAYLAWVTPGADSIPNTQHVLAQTLIELDGDKAKAETHVVSYHRADFSAAGDHSDLHDACIGGRYLDRFREAWRGLAHRPAGDALRLGAGLGQIGRLVARGDGHAVQPGAFLRPRPRRLERSVLRQAGGLIEHDRRRNPV